MALVWVWVPVIGSGTDEDPFRADVPSGINDEYNNSIPSDSVTGRPLVLFARVGIDEADVANVPAIVAESHVPAHDIALIMGLVNG